MSAARKVLSYRYVQGMAPAPSLDEDDYQDDGDDDYDDYDAEEPQIMAQGHSPSRTLQYALASSSSQSQNPSFPTFDSIAEAVTNLQSRYSSTPSSAHNFATPLPSASAHTPPYERPPSSASSATSYTVATDYAAPAKLRQANRFQSGTRPLAQQPPFLPTIDSGEPLEWENMDFAEEYEDPFSDGSHSQQQTTVPYSSKALRRRSLDSSSSHDRASSFASVDEALLHHIVIHHVHPRNSPLRLLEVLVRVIEVLPPLLLHTVSIHVLPLPASSQDSIVEPTIGLVSKPNPAQQLQV
jgi:hypothetical protein